MSRGRQPSSSTNFGHGQQAWLVDRLLQRTKLYGNLRKKRILRQTVRDSQRWERITAEPLPHYTVPITIYLHQIPGLSNHATYQIGSRKLS